jgi:hypothetical protein
MPSYTTFVWNAPDRIRTAQHRYAPIHILEPLLLQEARSNLGIYMGVGMLGGAHGMCGSQ